MNFSSMIVFNEKMRSGFNRACASRDVSVLLCAPTHSDKHSMKSERFQISFRNDVWQLICHDVERIAYACIFDCILFKQSENGYKLSSQSRTKTRCIQVTVVDKELSQQLRNMVGDYDLKFDSTTGFYYIEKGEKS